MNKICSNHFECNDSLAKRNDENEPGHLSNLVNGDDLKKDQTKKCPSLELGHELRLAKELILNMKRMWLNGNHVTGDINLVLHRSIF